MSKQSEVPAVLEPEVATPELVNNGVSVVRASISPSLHKHLKSQIAKAQTLQNEVELVSEYLELEEGDIVYLAFIGYTEMQPAENAVKTLPNGMIPAVQFMGEDEKLYISAATIIVNTCRNLNPGDILKVTCTGEEKAKVGKYKTFSIKKMS